jgi:hypothetical protein
MKNIRTGNKNSHQQNISKHQYSQLTIKIVNERTRK